MAVFDLILGPILMGTVVNIFLMGIMLVQCYIYFERFKGDKYWMRPLVWFLLLIDALGSCFDIAMTYNYLVTNFGNVAAIAVTNIGITPYPFLTGITAFAVQCFFAWRIKLLIKSNLLAYFIVALSLLQLLASLGTMIGGIIVKDFASLIKIKQISLVWLFGSVVTDIIITVSLVWFLRRHKTGFSTTDHITDRIIRLTLQTGLLTTTCALGVVIAYLVSDTTMHLAFGLPLSKLYTNSLMSSLNARKGWNPSDFAESGTSTSRSTRIQTEVRTSTVVHEDAASESHELGLTAQKRSYDRASSSAKVPLFV